MRNMNKFQLRMIFVFVSGFANDKENWLIKISQLLHNKNIKNFIKKIKKKKKKKKKTSNNKNTFIIKQTNNI